eukprot:623486-Prorocentrum_minimum.AAC.2
MFTLKAKRTKRAKSALGICSPPARDWLPPWVYALHRPAIYSRPGYMLSTGPRLAAALGICSPPARDWLPPW